MNKTKKKIILAAITLFNNKGLTNVRNQDIAKEAGISLSNFNYHFSTKKDLVLAVFTYMGEILQEEVYGRNDLLIKEDQGLEIAKKYFEFEGNFRFFYLDTNNIIQTYPEMKEALQEQIEVALQIIKNINYLSVGRGYMKQAPEEMPDLYDRLSEQILINNHFWFAQMTMRGLKENVVQKGLEANFMLCYPYLTEKGKERFKIFLNLHSSKEDAM